MEIKSIKMMIREGRTAVRISREDFLEKVKNLHNEWSYTEESDWNIPDVNSNFSLSAFYRAGRASIDLETVLISCNKDTASSDKANFNVDGSLMGLQTLENGLHFIGFWAGGDDEGSAFLIIYWDGKSFRGYIPLAGNYTETVFHCTLCSAMNSDYGPWGKYYHLVDDRLMEMCRKDLSLMRVDGTGKVKMDWGSIKNNIIKGIEVK